MEQLGRILDTTLGLPAPALAALGLWLAGMISLPILKWTRGDRAVPLGISVGVILQAAAALAVLGSAWSAPRVLAAAVLVPACGWAVEFLGSRTGFPFGPYHYTKRLQPQLGKVPILIPIAWLMMAPAAWAVAEALAPDAPLALRSVIAGGAFMAWDLYLDPQMVAWGFWKWDRRGAYFGIPIVNFVGWWVAASLMCLLVGLAVGGIGVPQAPLLAMYGITWLLQAGGLAFFWGLPGPALAGFVGMGAFAVSAVLSTPA